MRAYEALFFILFDFYKSNRSEISIVTDDMIAVHVAVILSILPVLNLLTFYKNIEVEQSLFISGLLLVINYFIFVYADQFRKIVKRFRVSPPGFGLKLAGVSYVVLTLLGIILTRMIKVMV